MCMYVCVWQKKEGRGRRGREVLSPVIDPIMFSVIYFEVVSLQ